jgi:hypothetical protein
MIENLALENAINLQLGQWQNTQAITGSVERNVCLDAHDINGEPRGFGISTNHGGPINSPIFAGNICSHQRKGTYNSIAFLYGAAGGTTGGVFRDNIAWAWDGPNGGIALSIPKGNNPGLSIRRNVFRCFGTNDLIRGTSSAAIAEATWEGNRYARPAPAEWFKVGSSRLDSAGWQALTAEAVVAPPAYPDSERSIEVYADEVLGEAPTLGAFLAGAREQRKGAWDLEYTAPAVIDWIRAGFSLDPIG